MRHADCHFVLSIVFLVVFAGWKSMIRVHDRDLEAARQVDAATQALVPALTPGTLPSDPKHLDTMFVFCTANWRAYPGEKPTGNKLVREPTASVSDRSTPVLQSDALSSLLIRIPVRL